MGRRVIITFLFFFFLLWTAAPMLAAIDSALILHPENLDMVFNTPQYLLSHRQQIKSLLQVDAITLQMKEQEMVGIDFSQYREGEEQVLAFTDKGLTLQNRFELMDGVAIIGSYRMEGSSEEGMDDILFSQKASGEITVDAERFLNMGISIHLIQEAQNMVSTNRELGEGGGFNQLPISYRDDLLPGGELSFREEQYDYQNLQRTGVALNLAPFDRTVVLADYILQKDVDDLNTRITSLGLEYEDERNRLLAKYELAASEVNRRSTALAGMEVGITPWGNFLATFQWANQQYLEEVMKESVLDLGLDIFLSDTTSLLLGYKFIGQDWQDIQSELDSQTERSNVAGARLKFRF